MAHLLVIGPEGRERKRLISLLEARGHRLADCETLAQARKLLPLSPFDAVLCFHHLPDGTVLDLLGDSTRRVVVLADLQQSSLVAEALGRGAVDYLPLPIDPEEVTACATRITRNFEGPRERGDVRFEARGATLILHFPPALSYTATLQLNRLLAGKLAEPAGGIAISMEETEQLGSGGIGLLFLLLRAFGQHNTPVPIAGATPRIRHLIEIAGGHTAFRFFPSLAEALDSVRGDRPSAGSTATG